MPTPFFFIHQPEYGKPVAWVTTVLLSLAGVLFLKRTIAALAMKLYEFFVQKNGLG